MTYGTLSSPLDPKAPDFAAWEATKTGQPYPNVPGPEAEAQIHNLAVHVLQPLRNMFGRSVNIDSWYRSPAVNAAVGGAENSDHMQGTAADIKIQGFTNREIAAYLWTRADLPLGEVIWYTYKGHTHVSYDPKNRREFLVATAPKVYKAWRPAAGEVEAVLRRMGGGAGDAGTGAEHREGLPPVRTAPYVEPPHVQRMEQASEGGGGGGVILVGLALVVGAAAAAGRSGLSRDKKKRGKK